MQPVARYRVTSPFLAVREAINNDRFVTLPVDAIIEAGPDDLHHPGLKRIRLNGEDLLVFARDILTRTDAIDEAGWSKVS